jgi:hypothetical protein
MLKFVAVNKALPLYSVHGSTYKILLKRIDHNGKFRMLSVFVKVA